MCRLHSELKKEEAVQEMCGNSNGALVACTELLGYFSEVFPRCSGEEITSIKVLDELGIYERSIAHLYFNTYHGDTRKLLLAINAYCVGRIDRAGLLHPQRLTETIH